MPIMVLSDVGETPTRYCCPKAPFSQAVVKQNTQQQCLQALLLVRPRVKLLQESHKSQKNLPPALNVADYLEYVDQQTGLTPLLASIASHRSPAASLVRSANHQARLFTWIRYRLHCSRQLLRLQPDTSAWVLAC